MKKLWAKVKSPEDARNFANNKRQAEAGDASAMSRVAHAYVNGSGVPEDHDKAFSWYVRSAEAGSSHGVVGVAQCFRHDRGTRFESPMRAVEWFTRAAELGDEESMYDLGMAYECGRGVEQDLLAALHWYWRLSDDWRPHVCEAEQRIRATMVSNEQAADASPEQATATSEQAFLEHVWQELAHEPWWRPDADRASAEADLAGLPPGCFLVRPSAKANCLALSQVDASEGVFHGLIKFNGPLYGYSHQDSEAYPTIAVLLQCLPGLRFDVGPAAESVVHDSTSMAHRELAAARARELIEKRAELSRAPAADPTMPGSRMPATEMNNMGVRFELGVGVKKELTIALEWYIQASAAGSEFAPANVQRVQRRIAMIDMCCNGHKMTYGARAVLAQCDNCLHEVSEDAAHYICSTCDYDQCDACTGSVRGALERAQYRFAQEQATMQTSSAYTSMRLTSARDAGAPAVFDIVIADRRGSEREAVDVRARRRAELEAEEAKARKLEAEARQLEIELRELEVAERELDAQRAAEQARLAAATSAIAAAPARPGGVAVLAAPGAPRSPVPHLPVRRGNAPAAAPMRQPLPAPGRAAAAPSLPSAEAEEMARMREELAQLKLENETLARTRRPTVVVPIAEDELHDLREIGKGAFGKVFKGKRNHEHVAVKMVNNDAYGTEEDIRNEVAVLRKLPAHTNIVSYRCVASINGQLALVLEFCAGDSLEKALAGASDADWPRLRQFKVASGIASGAAYLHKNKIVHRDLAARNVLLTGDSVARVTDFGMSIKSEALDAAKTTSAFGATAWMAPEQLIKDDAGQYTFSSKSDVYSFGVVMYELFERQEPWSHCFSRDQIVAKLLAGETLPLDDDKYPEVVLSIVKRCWAVAKKRPEMEMIADLLSDSYEAAVKKSQRGSVQKMPLSSSAPPVGYFSPVVHRGAAYFDDNVHGVEGESAHSHSVDDDEPQTPAYSDKRPY